MVYRKRGNTGAAKPGRKTTEAELERLGLVAAPESTARVSLAPARFRARPSNRRMPDYARCLAGAPLNSDKTGPDISRADFTFAVIAAMQRRGNDGAYAARTVANATAAVARRGPTQRRNVLRTRKQG